ncbi:hypothetical protein LUZ63_003678 [Rhynchospora breviuscula]|uniref:KIB1-4 beta-propeller domain-containing protein n=1 Tax=Rhynchospora breviuscula TaxID=2022672 RepID=A0A9Q0D148_9POAL|nr:hypothetical protein LUZ63_003678 [Rhynchospora breviuscula]
MSTSQTPQSPTRDWSEIPDLILATIARLLLPSLHDLYSFASVCPSWRSLLRSLSPSLLRSLPPLLLTPSSSHLLSPINPPFPFSPSPLLLPHSSNARFLSFSHGHLLFLPSLPSLPLLLLQPFLADVITGSHILLPPLPSDYHRFPYYYATLTAPPSSPSSRFLLFFSKFAFLSCYVSSPDATWTRHRYSPDISFIVHVVSFKGRLFGLNDRARLLEIDISSDQTPSVRFFKVLRPVHAPHDFDRWHFGPQLVATSEQLLLVLFVFNNGTNISTLYPERRRVRKIEVYSLDWKRMEWVEVKALPDCAIFVDCAGKSPILCEKPENWGGESGCVYVAGPGFDRWRRCLLDENMVVPLRPLLFSTIPEPRWPSPIWIQPSLFY